MGKNIIWIWIADELGFVKPLFCSFTSFYASLMMKILNYVAGRIVFKGIIKMELKVALHDVKIYMWHKLHIVVLLVLLFAMSATSISGTSDTAPIHDIDADPTKPECQSCHLTQDDRIFQPQLDDIYKEPFVPTEQPMATSAISGGPQTSSSNGSTNYTAILTVGQTPYQLGPFFRGGVNGWSWWDVNNFGTEKQKNLITLMILDNTSINGTNEPVTGLTSLPAWPQASYRNHSGTYSYKADTDPAPITSQNNYADLIDLWMLNEIDLTGFSNANLTFWTWYSLEAEYDYGYVSISIDDGNNWINIPGITTYPQNGSNQFQNLGNGFTGNSGGWIQETMNLTPYIGNEVLLGFRFKSDEAANEEGWYVDDIKISSDSITIFSDDADITPTVRTLSVNVSYPNLTLINPTDPLTNATTLQYNPQIRQVDLYEDLTHPGTYLGYFVYDPFTEQYSGNYTVMLDISVNNTPITTTTQFHTTILGCQSCHNKNQFGNESTFIHSDGGGTGSCMDVCHTGSRRIPFFGMRVNLNPMHVHEMQLGHYGGFLSGISYDQPPYNVTAHVATTTCIQCHTSFVHDNTGTDTAKIATYTLYGTNISFPAGTHKNLTCEFCHGTLDYPEIPQDQYQLQGSFTEYTTTSTSHESFTNTYIIASNGTENLTVAVTSNSPSTKSITLSIVGAVDNTTTARLNSSRWKIQNLATPINLEVAEPDMGTWLVKVIQLQAGDEINYTIASNYPIEAKPIIKVPECNTCHNSTTSGGAYTELEIPDWSTGFAHTDIDNDGDYDVQCRMCHDAMHDIKNKGCQKCHTVAPTKHPMGDPAFSQYTPQECLVCHGDPHYVAPAQMRADCLTCHPDRNNSLFAGSKHSGIDGEAGVVDNSDCWGCHNTDGTVNGNYLKYIDAIDSSDDVYSNDNFSICFNCHAIEELLAVPQPDIFMRILLNTSLKIPLYNTTWSTNFYGDSWWKNSMDSNLHQFHLVELRAMGGLPSTGAYCAKCHAPHGTTKPALIVDNLNFSYLYQNGSVITSRDEWYPNYGGIINGFNGSQYQFCKPCHDSDNRYMRMSVV